MLKIVPQIKAILKSFVRNKTYMLLLIVAPLLLISAIFLSFGAKGIQKMPVGTIGESANFDIERYKDNYFSYLDITRFNSTDECLDDLKDYNQYLCIEIKEKERVTLHIYYDNTRPVIWEVIEKIKASVDYLQKQQSKKLAAGFLQKIQSTNDKVDKFSSELDAVNRQIDVYIVEINSTITGLENTKKELSTTLGSMDAQIEETKESKSELEVDKEELYDNSMDNLDQIMRYSGRYPDNDSDAARINSEARNLKESIVEYNDDADSFFEDIDTSIYSYQIASGRGRDYVDDIDAGIGKLEKSKDGLENYKTNISSTQQDLDTIAKELSDMQILKPDNLVSPVVVKGSPTYVANPNANLKNETEQTRSILQGLEMISLQTVYPTVLFLIILFLSLLISSFVALSEINSSANTRIGLVKRPALYELAAIFFASLVIIIVPIFLILAMGNILFKIDIIGHLGSVLAIVILTISAFIMLGMILAYLVRKESITLLLTTFILVLLIFLSGAILPVERMSTVSNMIATNSPSHLGLLAFNRVAFYDQGFMSISGYLLTIIIWISILFTILFLMKKYRTPN